MMTQKRLITIFLCCCATLWQITKVECGRKNARTSKVKDGQGCAVGDKFYNLAETWRPDSGGYGDTPCMLCACQTGDVICRNLTESCPPAVCQDAVTLPGECCQVCSKREFYSLLVGVKEAAIVVTSAVARGAFTVLGDSLVYAIRVHGMTEPTKLLVVDENDQLQYQKKLKKILRSGKDLSICGTWSHLSDSQQLLLNTGKLRVIIATVVNKKGAIAGVLSSHPALTTETFSGIMTSGHQGEGRGAIALISFDAGQKAMDFTIIFDSETPFEKGSGTVSLVSPKGPRRSINVTVGEEVQGTVPGLKKKELVLLAKQQVRLLITLPGGVEFSGVLLPKTTCLSHQAVLQSPGDAYGSAVGAGAGLIAKLRPNGSIKFKMQYTGLGVPVRDVTVEALEPDAVAPRLVASMKPRNLRENGNNLDGSARGTATNINALDVSSMLKGTFSVSLTIVAMDTPSLRGYVTSIPYHEVLEKQRNKPVLLTGSDAAPPVLSAMAASVWIGADKQCTLHFQLVVMASKQGQTMDAFLESFEGRTETLELVSFTEGYVQGTSSDVTRGLWRALNKGKAYINIATEDHPTGEIASPVRIANKCWRDKPSPIFSKGDGERLPGCHIGDVIYEESETWQPEVDNPCVTCTCEEGQVLCREKTCPPLNCDQQYVVFTLTTCCPVCRAGTTDT